MAGAGRAGTAFLDGWSQHGLFRVRRGAAVLASGEGAGQPGASTYLYFRTANIEQQFATLQQRNVKIVRPPHIIAALPNQDLWLLWFRDSEGNLLGIMEERKKSSSQ